MKSNKTSKQEKHEHAVVVCSIIGRKGSLPLEHYSNENIHDKHNKPLNFLHDILTSFFPKRKHPHEESSEEKEIKEIISEKEFKRLKKLWENYQKNNQLNDDYGQGDPLRDWKPIDINGKKHYLHCYMVLGEYDPDKRIIILYTKNIEKCCYNNNEEKDKLKKTILFHEMFHAYFHYVTEQEKCNYNYIFYIEEAMAEFCSLVSLQDMSSKASDWKDVFDYAKKNIKDNQNEFGDLAASGFGAYLFEKTENDDTLRYELINNYIQKLGHINENDDKVKEYCQKVRLSKFVLGNQEYCLNLLKEILEPTAN